MEKYSKTVLILVGLITIIIGSYLFIVKKIYDPAKLVSEKGYTYCSTIANPFFKKVTLVKTSHKSVGEPGEFLVQAIDPRGELIEVSRFPKARAGVPNYFEDGNRFNYLALKDDIYLRTPQQALEYAKMYIRIYYGYTLVYILNRIEEIAYAPTPLFDLGLIIYPENIEVKKSPFFEDQMLGARRVETLKAVTQYQGVVSAPQIEELGKSQVVTCYSWSLVGGELVRWRIRVFRPGNIIVDAKLIDKNLGAWRIGM